MIRNIAALAIGLVATLGGTASWAENARIYARPGATSQDVAEATLACRRDVAALGSPGVVNVNVQEIDSKGRIGPPSGPTALGGAIGGALVQAFVDSEFHRAAMPGCMHARGFVRIELTEEQNGSYQGLSSDVARADWEDAYRRGMSPKAYAEAMKPKATPLPKAWPEPYVVSPVRLDPRSVKLAVSPVTRGGTLFTSDGFYSHTARVTSQTLIGEFRKFGKAYPLVVPGGAIYRQTYGSQLKVGPWEDKTLWCGPATIRDRPANVCFRSTFNGYQTSPTYNMPEWLPMAPPVFEFAMVFGQAALPLEELPIDPATSSPFGVVLKVDRVSPKAVQLRAVALRGREEIPFWGGTAAFDDSGRAIVPFWAQRLILTRAGKGVSAIMEQGGDGSGWQ